MRARYFVYCLARKGVYFDAMSRELLSELEGLMAETGLSAHRVGILCARNGRIIDRLRAGGRVWPETENEIRSAICRERSRRSENGASQ